MKNSIKQTIHQLVTPTLMLAIASVLSRMLGMLRDHLFAGYFGASLGQGIYDLDTYYAAFRIPDFLYQLLIYGTVSSAFIPLFSEFLHTKNKEEAWKFANNVLNIVTIIISGIALISFILSPWIVPLFVPGFDQEKIQLTIMLSQIMLLSPIFFGISSIFQSIQNTVRHFTSTALVPIIYNLSIIVATILWGKTYGVYALTGGVIAGAVLQCLIQIPFNKKIGYAYTFITNWKQKELKEMLRMIVPRIAGISAGQMNLLTDTILASFLGTGSIVVLNYAINLNSFPIGVIGVSFAIVGFSTLAQQAAQKDFEEMGKTVQETMEKLLLLIIPATIGMLVLRVDLVAFLLESGKFQNADTIRTANILGIFTLSLFAQSTIPFLGRIFYANKNTRTPVIGSIGAVMANIIMSIIGIFIFKLDLMALAIANTLANIGNFIYLNTHLKKVIKIQNIKIYNMKNLLKICTASILMAGVILLEQKGIQLLNLAPKIKEITTLALLGLSGVIVYFKTLKALGYKKIPAFFGERKNIDEELSVN